MTELGRALCNAVAMARIGCILPSGPDPTVSPIKAHLLGSFLPSIHLLAVVAVLDEGLATFIEENRCPWPKRAKRDLRNRIEVAGNQMYQIDKAKLHEIRQTRNRIAHSVDPQFPDPLTWERLNEMITGIIQAFVTMNFLVALPNVQAYFERDAMFLLDELGPSGELIRQTFRVGAQLDGRPFLEHTGEIAYPPFTPS